MSSQGRRTFDREFKMETARLIVKVFSMDNGDNKGLSTGGVAAPR